MRNEPKMTMVFSCATSSKKFLQPVGTLTIAVNVENVGHLFPPAYARIFSSTPRFLNGIASERLEYLSVRHAAHHKFRKRLVCVQWCELPSIKKSGISKPLSSRRREMFRQFGLVATRMIDWPRISPSAAKWPIASPQKSSSWQSWTTCPSGPGLAKRSFQSVCFQSKKRSSKTTRVYTPRLGRRQNSCCR
jgi:hypothetical protein